MLCLRTHPTALFAGWSHRATGRGLPLWVGLVAILLWLPVQHQALGQAGCDDELIIQCEKVLEEGVTWIEPIAADTLLLRLSRTNGDDQSLRLDRRSAIDTTLSLEASGQSTGQAATVQVESALRSNDTRYLRLESSVGQVALVLGSEGEAIASAERPALSGGGGGGVTAQDWLAMVTADERIAAGLAAVFLLGILMALIVANKSRISWPRRRTFGDYTIEGDVGAGGMAHVYRAREPEGHTVALKVMKKDMMENEDLSRKFLQEAQALRRILETHPEAPVPQVYDAGREPGSGQLYIAMEYIDGTPLSTWLRGGHTLEEAQAAAVIRQVGLALQAAHANNVYHRDVKPANVLILNTQSAFRAMLIDFGVARHEYTELHTLSGSMFGTPPYMPPELGTDQPYDKRSDIYSLGILFYALLKGAPPFVDDSPLRVLTMHQEMQPPPLPSHVSAPTHQLISSMLAKDPADRPQTMWAVLSRLQTARSLA
jgi:tRNA A-37 threonylcarbamoyl transferase component Bud32